MKTAQIAHLESKDLFVLIFKVAALQQTSL